MLLIQRKPAYIFLRVLLLGIFFAPGLAFPPLIHSAAATAPIKDVYVSARLIADNTAVQPGKPFHLGVELTMQPGWHTYYKEPGDSGMGTKIEWLLPPGFTAKSLQWEKPKRLDEEGLVTYVYPNKTLIAAEISAPQKLAGGAQLDFGAKVRWLSCREMCVPGGTVLNLILPVAESGGTPINTQAFSQTNFEAPVSSLESEKVSPAGSNILDQKLTIAGNQNQSMGLVGYLALAFIGGIILNFMPCVLPVVAIKVLSLLEQAEKDRSRVRILGVAFAAGILSSFLSLAGLVIALQAAGQKIGWGFQFQYPPFVMAMSTIVLLFALGLFGMINFSVSLAQKEVSELADQEGILGTFFKGVLATILSTPCTAPFLGTAVGFAFARPWWEILAVFLAVGLGMAAPYMLLTMNPDWMKFLPRPGVWMEKLKEAFGFVLLATVAWLLSVLGNQVGIDGLSRMIYFLLAVTISIWVIEKFSNLASSKKRTVIVRSVALAITGLAFCILILSQPSSFSPTNQVSANGVSGSGGSSEGWQPFSISTLNANINSGKTVLVDFSAKWCLTCQVNESTVLRSKEVEEKLKSLKAVLMQADWTNQDASITTILGKFGRSGVPLYVIFPAKAPDHPIVLPEIIDKALVLQKLDEAGPSLASPHHP